MKIQNSIYPGTGLDVVVATTGCYQCYPDGFPTSTFYPLGVIVLISIVAIINIINILAITIQENHKQIATLKSSVHLIDR